MSYIYYDINLYKKACYCLSKEEIDTSICIECSIAKHRNKCRNCSKYDEANSYDNDYINTDDIDDILDLYFRNEKNKELFNFVKENIKFTTDEILNRFLHIIKRTGLDYYSSIKYSKIVPINNKLYIEENCFGENLTNEETEEYYCDICGAKQGTIDEINIKDYKDITQTILKYYKKGYIVLCYDILMSINPDINKLKEEIAKQLFK